MQSSAIKDRQFSSFVDSPSRSESSAREVYSIEPSLHTLKDRASSQVIYTGETTTINSPSTTGAIWRIYREINTLDSYVREYAGSGGFDQVWDDRLTLFDPPENINEISVNLDGINDYLDGGDIHNYDIANSFSVAMWVKPDNISATRILFSKADNSVDVNGYMLRHNITTGDLFLQMRTPATKRTYQFNKSLTAGVWQHVVFTYAGGSNINGAHVYLNGSKSTTPTSGTLSGSMITGQSFYIGQRTSNFYFSGKMDEIIIYNKELTQSDVDELYSGGSVVNPTLLSTSANIASYYPIDSYLFPFIEDTVGGLNLEMKNMNESDLQGDVP